MKKIYFRSVNCKKRILELAQIDYTIPGISRSFTRKLHEWEKSRGIAPEASTSALLRAARARGKAPQAPLTRTKSDGSVAPSTAGSGRMHASSLSVNDVDDIDSDYERDHSVSNLLI